MSDTPPPDGLDKAWAMLPTALYLLTASYEDTRAGVLVSWVQRCANEPPLLSVSAEKGHTLEPLIRDSRAFGVCRINPEDKFLRRKFSAHRTPDEIGDPFDSLGVELLETGSPILKRSIVAFDCEVVRHFDIDADHELFIGQILAVRV
jgi:flavin reductase (DIM6/NTAB) family NADH-FMN oxidoreductase RutF